MKRKGIRSALLAVLLVLTLCVAVMAAGEPHTGSAGIGFTSPSPEPEPPGPSRPDTGGSSGGSSGGGSSGRDSYPTPAIEPPEEELVSIVDPAVPLAKELGVLPKTGGGAAAPALLILTGALLIAGGIQSKGHTREGKAASA